VVSRHRARPAVRLPRLVRLHDGAAGRHLKQQKTTPTMLSGNVSGSPPGQRPQARPWRWRTRPGVTRAERSRKPPCDREGTSALAKRPETATPCEPEALDHSPTPSSQRIGVICLILESKPSSNPVRVTWPGRFGATAGIEKAGFSVYTDASGEDVCMNDLLKRHDHRIFYACGGTCLATPMAQQPGPGIASGGATGGRGRGAGPSARPVAKAEETGEGEGKTEQIEALVKGPRAKHAKPGTSGRR